MNQERFKGQPIIVELLHPTIQRQLASNKFTMSSKRSAHSCPCSTVHTYWSPIIQPHELLYSCNYPISVTIFTINSFLIAMYGIGQQQIYRMLI